MFQIQQPKQRFNAEEIAVGEDELLKDCAVASMLGVSTRTLKDWRRKKTGPKYVAIGRNTVRYRVGDVREFIQRKASNNGQS